MSEEIIKILDDLGRRFGIVIDWSSENVMPYLQDLMSRYVTYETLTSIMWAIAGIIVLIIGIVCTYKTIKNEDDDMRCFCIFPLILSTIGLVMIWSQIVDIITVNTIPEKMIYEYLSSSIS